MSDRPSRNLVICAEDTKAGAKACQFAVDNFYDENTVFHLVYIVKSLMPPMEVFHNAPGTSFAFDQPGPHDENKKIALAKEAIERRYLPVLREKMVRYQLHLFAERKDASPQKVGSTILKCATDLQPFIVVLAAHNQTTDVDRFEGKVGSVAQWLLKECKLPLALVRPETVQVGSPPPAS